MKTITKEFYMCEYTGEEYIDIEACKRSEKNAAEAIASLDDRIKKYNKLTSIMLKDRSIKGRIVHYNVLSVGIIRLLSHDYIGADEHNKFNAKLNKSLTELGRKINMYRKQDILDDKAKGLGFLYEKNMFRRIIGRCKEIAR